MTNNFDKIAIVIENSDANQRLDVIITKHVPNLSRAKVQKLIEQNYVEVTHNNIQIAPSASYRVKEADSISIAQIEIEQKTDIVATNIPISTLYEDEQLLLINKPWGLVVHPGAGNMSNTLVNGLLYKYNDKLSGINESFRPGIVHRLDKDTSGILVVAKNDNTHEFLSKQFQDHTIIRNYRVLVYGVPLQKSGEIKTFITRSKINRKRMVTHDTKGKFAHTIYKIIGTYENFFSLIDISLKTGRTHQIRLHMAHLGHSVVGDPVYGRKRNFKKLNPEVLNLINNLKHQALHAYRLGFIHPNLQYLCAEQAEPEDLQTLYLTMFNGYKEMAQSKVIKHNAGVE